MTIAMTSAHVTPTIRYFRVARDFLSLADWRLSFSCKFCVHKGWVFTCRTYFKLGICAKIFIIEICNYSVDITTMSTSTMSITLSNAKRFSELLHRWKREFIFFCKTCFYGPRCILYSYSQMHNISQCDFVTTCSCSAVHLHHVNLVEWWWWWWTQKRWFEIKSR